MRPNGADQLSFAVLAQLASICVGVASPLQAQEPPAWSGHGEVRILVEIAAIERSGAADDMVAACDLDFGKLIESTLPEAAGSKSADVTSFQVHKYDPATGDPEAPPHRYGLTRYDRPCRYEDTEIPDEYASRVGRASETLDGRPPAVVRRRKARLFNRQMDNRRGRIVWSHREEPGKPSHYAIYFNLQAESAAPQVPAAPWIGDADPLRTKTGQALGGFSHFTAAVGDLNGDGLFDLVAGTEKGDVFWFANRGTAQEPKFVGCELLQDGQGPIDLGWYAAPFLFDWDNDRDLDLLIGTSGNCILWWRNAGNAATPKFEYQGFVKADGKRLDVPEAPVAEDDNGIFARDYFNQPWVGDLDGDSLPDIVTGGYTTGRIFWYRGQRRGANGDPELSYAGMLESDGKSIDTIWAAAPYCLDLNGDENMDLITGGWRWSGIPTPPKPGEEDLLHYYEGVSGKGADRHPKFAQAAFPANGELPSGSIARPSAIDANNDGLVDLFVSESGGNAYLLYNIGTREAPRWDVTTPPLTAPWGFVRDFDVGAATADVDGDGTHEFIVGNVISSIEGSPAVPHKKLLGVAHVAGKPIAHAGPGYGDPYYYSILCEWNDDDRADILWGTQQGNLYVHRNLASSDPLAFSEGEQVQLTTGELLRLGPAVVDSPQKAVDFTILQGSRIVFTYEDFDGDGEPDIIAGDTYGNLWAFLGHGPAEPRLFEPGLVVTKLPTRPESIACMDANGDGRPDLLIGGTADDPVTVFTNASQPGRPAVEAGPAEKGLPYLFWGPKLRACDWNRDGDLDLMVQSEFFSFWIERSFLNHGYRHAKIMSDLQTAARETKVEPSP